MQALSTSRLRLAARVLILLLVQAAITAWIYRANWTDGFRLVLGDVYDNTIEIAILEHWYNVLRGLAHWPTTNYFYPYPATLGYNDGYFLYGLLYAAGRWAGADPFLAATLVNVGMKAACFGFFYLCARRVLRAGFWYALAGAAVLELSNNVAIHSMHAQLLTIALVPLCATLLYFAGRAFLERRPGRLLAYGGAFALTYGAWALTSFYMLWFFSLFLALFLPVLAALRWSSLRAQLARLDRRTVLAGAACLLLLALCLLPFLHVYLPKARATGMHSFHDARGYALAPFDILNIGIGNYLYGGWLPALHHAVGFPVDYSERQMGVTPGLLLSFLAASCCLWRSGRAPIAVAAAAATVAIWALALTVHGITAWVAVFHLVPGAKAIRVIARSLIFLSVPMLLVSLAGLGEALRGRSRWLHACALAACAFVVTEQLNQVSYTAIDRHAATAALRRIAPAPPGCRAFVADDTRPLAADQGPVDHLYRHNVEAMLIAEYIGLPTINGFSSFNPPDWDLANPQLPDYHARAAAYAQRHRIDGLCHLDLATQQWSGPTHR